MLARLLAVPIVLVFPRFALGLFLGTVLGECLGGILVVMLSRAASYAAVLNQWIKRQKALADVPNLRVKVVGVLLRLEGPHGKSAHSASREGADEIMTILERMAASPAIPEALIPEKTTKNRLEEIKRG
jgi:hypothetical protein